MKNRQIRIIAVLLATVLAYAGLIGAAAVTAQAADNAPVVQPVTAQTCVDIAVEAELSAADADNDVVLYQLTEKPRLGTAKIEGSTLLCLAMPLLPPALLRLGAALYRFAMPSHRRAYPRPCHSLPFKAYPCRCYLSGFTPMIFALSRICRPYFAALIALPITRRCMSLTFSVFLLASVISCFLPSAVTTTIAFLLLACRKQQAFPRCYHADSQQGEHDSCSAEQVNPAILGHTGRYQYAKEAHSCMPATVFVGHRFQSPFAVSCNPRT